MDKIWFKNGIYGKLFGLKPILLLCSHYSGKTSNKVTMLAGREMLLNILCSYFKFQFIS